MSASSLLPRSLASIPRWAALLVVALAARAITFGNPVVHVDEQFYFAAARVIAHGAVPYVDVWDRKPVGLFLLYLPAAALGLPFGIWGYQILALVSATGTATLIARLADRAGWTRGALPAAIAYLLWLDLLEGQGGQSPVFYNLPMAAAALLLVPRSDDADRPERRIGSGAAAFALIGLALQIKYAVVFEGAFFGLWWLWREHRLGRPAWHSVVLGGVMAGLAALPTLLAWGWFTAVGYGDAFTFANFHSILLRHADPFGEQALNLLAIVLLVSPLLALGALGVRLPSASSHEAVMRRWLGVWTAVAAVALIVVGGYFDHYAIPLLVPLSVCAAGFCDRHHHARAVMVPLLVILFFAGQAMLLLKIHQRGTAPQFEAVAQAIGRGPGCLYVYSGPSIAYAATDRCTVTRYLFPSHLARVRERGAIGTDQRGEIERILARRPAVIVVQQPYRGERGELRALVMRHLAEAYRHTAALPLGTGRVEIYSLNEALTRP